MGLFDRTTARHGRSRSTVPGGQAGGGAAGNGGAWPRDALTSGPVPNTRELRAQVVHRLQVGLFGLSAMLLLVSLANVIMERAKQVDRATIHDSASPLASASATPVNDPLVDLGVAPELPVGTKTSAPSGSAGGQSPARGGAGKP